MFEQKGFLKEIMNIRQGLDQFHLFSAMIQTSYFPENQLQFWVSYHQWSINTQRVMRDKTKCEQLSGPMSRQTVEAVRFNCIIPYYSMPQTAP